MLTPFLKSHDPAMKKIILAIGISIIMLPAAAQSKRKVSTWIELLYHHTIYDLTRANNPWGTGLGLQTFVNTSEKWKLMADLSAFIYLEDDKVMRLDENDNEMPDVRSMANLFAGISFHPSSACYLTLVGGPSFVGGQTLFGIKPGFGFYFSPKQRWKGQISFVNVFGRSTEFSKSSFGSASFSIGLRLF
jgi:hypothetical protein